MRLSIGVQHRRVSGSLPNGLVSMRVQCTLPTETSKPNMRNTIEHAGEHYTRSMHRPLLSSLLRFDFVKKIERCHKKKWRRAGNFEKEVEKKSF
jgi:hypothetical protein